MSDRSQGETPLVQFSERLTNSAAFGTLFREGMDLVEETAAYLDGAGRTEAKALDRTVSLTYATESMRLTTRLMQLASWLLLHRAVKEGEMTLTQANREKTKVKLSAAEPGPDDMIEKLPQQLQDLIGRSMALQAKVRRLDTTIHAPATERAAIGNPLLCRGGDGPPGHPVRQRLQPRDRRGRQVRSLEYPSGVHSASIGCVDCLLPVQTNVAGPAAHRSRHTGRRGGS